MSIWKKILFWGFAIPLGATVGAALIVGGIDWFMPRPWNKNAIIATFHFIETEGNPNSLCFYYTLDNKTDKDYRVVDSDIETISALINIALVNPQERIPPESNVLTIDLPLFIPAKHKRRAILHLSRLCNIYQESFTDDKGNPDHEAFRAQLNDWVKEKMPHLAGFVVYDRKNRYQIEFPKGW